MYIAKGIFLGVGIFLIGFAAYLIRASTWLALIGVVLLCTALFRSRR